LASSSGVMVELEVRKSSLCFMAAEIGSPAHPCEERPDAPTRWSPVHWSPTNGRRTTGPGRPPTTKSWIGCVTWPRPSADGSRTIKVGARS